MLRTALLLWGCAAAGSCQASLSRYCDAPPELSAAQHDKLFRFAAVIKAELETSGAGVAIMARSGLDLGRFQLRYSHAGFSLKNSPETTWAVRQLYFACDEQKPRIFDQGLVAFLLGSAEPDTGYVSVLLLPEAASTALETTAQNSAQALQLLGAGYSANAYPFSITYQNCNQWVMEMLAAAWGSFGGLGSEGQDRGQDRARAQTWLQSRGYEPSVLHVGWAPLMWLGALIAYVHSDDHPLADYRQSLYRVSMPASIQTFVQHTVAGVTRIEFCHTSKQVVVHRGWDAIAEGCVAGADDRVISLD